MKLRKKIAAICAAMVMSVSMIGMSAVPTSATTYCNGTTLQKSKIPDNRKSFVKNVYGGGKCCGSIYSLRLSNRVYGISQDADRSCKYHYSRISTGGKVKEGNRVNSSATSMTDPLTIKNNSARFEGWYEVY
jgi:hypothetical protein